MTSDFPDHTEAAPTAADAAVLQLAEEVSNRLGLASSEAEIVRLPSAALFDWVVEAILPAVETFSVAKNVPTEPHEREIIAQFAAWHLSRRMKQELKRGSPDAVLASQLAVNHSLDILALMRMYCTVFGREGIYITPTELIAMAEDILKKNAANDKQPSKMIWPSLSEMVENHYAFVESGELPAITLPSYASCKCNVQQLRVKKRRPRKAGSS